MIEDGARCSTRALPPPNISAKTPRPLSRPFDGPAPPAGAPSWVCRKLLAEVRLRSWRHTINPDHTSGQWQRRQLTLSVEQPVTRAPEMAPEKILSSLVLGAASRGTT
jgi:hypothetical protein